MDAAQWHQGLGLGKPMEEMLMGGSANPNQNPNPPPAAPPSAPGAQRAGGAPAAGAGAGAAAAPSAGAAGGAGAGPERRARPKEKALNCPRCNSTNTKFCYYNNYSLQQPRYFCKTCRRYWTEGGSLRNVPVGGGSRKNKRSSSAVSSAAASTSAAMSGTVSVGGLPAKNPKLMHEGAHDLNLAFPHHNGGRALQPPEFAAFPSLESSSVCNPGAAGMVGNGAAGRGMGALSAMELLRSTGCYVPLQHVQLGMPAEYAAAGFALGEFRMPPPPQSQSLLGFSLDTHGGTGGVGGAGGYSAGLQDSAAGRLLFPFEDLKPAVSAGAGGGASNGADHHHQYEHSKDQAAGDGGSGASGVTGGHETPGFWSNSMIGNGNSNGGGGHW